MGLNGVRSVIRQALRRDRKVSSKIVLGRAVNAGDAGKSQCPVPSSRAWSSPPVAVLEATGLYLTKEKNDVVRSEGSIVRTDEGQLIEIRFGLATTEPRSFLRDIIG